MWELERIMTVLASALRQSLVAIGKNPEVIAHKNAQNEGFSHQKNGTFGVRSRRRAPSGLADYF